jgi:hypothetical protein
MAEADAEANMAPNMDAMGMGMEELDPMMGKEESPAPE